MDIQPVELWGHWGAPNPWKVCIVLEELKVPYKIRFLELPKAKEEAYLKINPNGRLPAIWDPNHNMTLWESGAIIHYLIEQYDQDGEISYRSFPEKYFTVQWLAFQISGQGPYFGQATWFARFHQEKLPSAINRYVDEMFRVTGVLNRALESTGTGWLVGNKATYADLAFVTWSTVAEGLLQELGKLEEFKSKFPTYMKWRHALEERRSVKKIKGSMALGRAQHGFQ